MAKLGYCGSQRGVVPFTECHLPERSLGTRMARPGIRPGLGLERISLRRRQRGEVMLMLESAQLERPRGGTREPAFPCSTLAAMM